MNLLYMKPVNLLFMLHESQSRKSSTYKAVEADPVGVRLVARGALHSESVKVRVLLSISGQEVSNTRSKH